MNNKIDGSQIRSLLSRFKKPEKDVEIDDLKPSQSQVSITCGDSLELLKTIKSDSIDSLITDPPAGISFMGKSWDSNKGGRDQWIKWMVKVMSECHRVLKPGAHGLVWAIDKTSHWTGIALEDAGFEVKHKIYHLFGSGFPKNRNIWKTDIKKILEKELKTQGFEGEIKWK